MILSTILLPWISWPEVYYTRLHQFISECPLTKTGGDNIFQVKTDAAVLDTQDEVLTAYIKSQTPVNIALEGRILNVNGTSTIQPIGGGSAGNATPTTSGLPVPPTQSVSMGSVEKRANFGFTAVCVMSIFALLAF
jgi:hypothetical protein